MQDVLESNETLRIDFISEINRALAQMSLDSLGVQIPRTCLGIDRPSTPLLLSPTPFAKKRKTARSRSVTPTHKRLQPLRRPHTSMGSPKTPQPKQSKRPRPRTTTTASESNSWFGEGNFPHFHKHPPEYIVQYARASTEPQGASSRRRSLR